MNGVIVRDLVNPSGKMPATFDGYQYVDDGELLMCLFDIDVTPRCIGRVYQRGVTSPAYSRFKLKENAYVGYYYYYYLMMDYTKELLHLAKNIRHSFTEEQLGALKVPLPPFEEQKRIADYLDSRCGEIDSLIEEAKASIGEYKRWKAIIINEAVTLGLKKGSPLQNTDIPGAERIPAHWKLNRFKNIATELYKGSGITKEDVVDDGNVSCVRYGEIYSKYDILFDECLTKTELDTISNKRFFSTGDILFAGTGELVEEIGKNIVYLGTEKCLAGGDIIVAKHCENPSFLSYALNSIYVQEQKSKGKAKLKVVHISAAEIGNLIVALPPINEQVAIADFLTDHCTKIDSIICEKDELISDLEMYKRSLIYETVTGKRKVV